MFCMWLWVKKDNNTKRRINRTAEKQIKNIHGIEEIPENIYFFNYYCNKCNIRFFPLKKSIKEIMQSEKKE